MKTYRVRFGLIALEDLNRSYLWGVERWGVDEADKWFAAIQEHVESKLSEMPHAFPVAKESQAFDYEVRQILFGRYRLLYTIAFDEVRILRVRGPYHESRDK